MRFVSSIAATLAFLGIFAVGAGSSLAEPPPSTFGGILSFQSIHGPSDPEEFSWTVDLSPEQELKAIDDQHAEVYYEDGHLAWRIDAQPAHDAVGTAVPTSLEVSDGNVVTLTVHHRAGNPAAGGAPFDYPISAGAGWEGGFSTVQIAVPPPKSEPREFAPANCVVPKLKGESLKASQRSLKKSGCELGKVRGERSRAARVVKQDLRPGTVLAAGTNVSVKLGA